ncbi:MAG TPA: hypothetical protein VGE11_02760 [Pseudonocardia sp.]
MQVGPDALIVPQRLGVKNLVDHSGEPGKKFCCQPIECRPRIRQDMIGRQPAAHLLFQVGDVSRFVSVVSRVICQQDGEPTIDIRDVEQTGRHLLLHGRGPVGVLSRDRQPGCRAKENPVQLMLDSCPLSRVLVGPRSPNQTAQRGDGVLVRPVPGVHQLSLGPLHSFGQHDEFVMGDRRGQRKPTTALPQQRQEVQLRRLISTSPHLGQADRHGLLVQRRLIADTPAKIDGLERRPTRRAIRRQRREDTLLQNPALSGHIREGRTHKDTEQPGEARHHNLPWPQPFANRLVADHEQVLRKCVLPDDEWVELRVHAVHATPPESMSNR